MKRMLGAEYHEFEACMREPHVRGVRVNTLKFDLKDVDRLGLPLSPCPFSGCGFYLGEDDRSIGNSPWHHAGAIYSQEPSAMSAVTILNPQPGERVLDLCAAPGGKSTQIAALLRGKGLLWSNEYVAKRAQALLSNIERMGAGIRAPLPSGRRSIPGRTPSDSSRFSTAPRNVCAQGERWFIPPARSPSGRTRTLSPPFLTVTLIFP